MKKRIPYGIGDFEVIRKENYYYVDKTKIIQELEKHRYPFFIRPRRFGKSLLISTLESYYDIEKKDSFDALFKGLWIHDNPTGERNSYLILRLDFSGIESDKGKVALFNSFLWKVKMKAKEFVNRYAPHYTQDSIQVIEKAESPSAVMETLCTLIRKKQIYLLIDEYDNFTNDLIGANEDNLYYEILSKTGFVRTFYETIKSGAQEGAISRIFLTGVSPIMLDD
ncbi:MAG: AAA family ATPase, partial [Thermotogota bacterium]|nr:AAA family ATPase [Thermotogota bacterium]